MNLFLSSVMFSIKKVSFPAKTAERSYILGIQQIKTHKENLISLFYLNFPRNLGTMVLTIESG